MPSHRRDNSTAGQESVWDYPRPPALRQTDDLVEVYFGGQLIASTREAVQVLETSHPPTYYLPRSAFGEGILVPTQGHTFCEFKGRADYFDVCVGDQVARRAVWQYPNPTQPFTSLSDHVALMPATMDACYVDGELVIPQEGQFYGGWITSKVSGPFKGGQGTTGW